MRTRALAPPALCAPTLLLALALPALNQKLMVLELASTRAWLFTGKGAAIVLKLVLLLMVPSFW